MIYEKFETPVEDVLKTDWTEALVIKAVIEGWLSISQSKLICAAIDSAFQTKHTNGVEYLEIMTDGKNSFQHGHRDTGPETEAGRRGPWPLERRGREAGSLRCSILELFRFQFTTSGRVIVFTCKVLTWILLKKAASHLLELLKKDGVISRDLSGAKFWIQYKISWLGVGPKFRQPCDTERTC